MDDRWLSWRPDGRCSSLGCKLGPVESLIFRPTHNIMRRWIDAIQIALRRTCETASTNSSPLIEAFTLPDLTPAEYLQSIKPETNPSHMS
jgi:hypothetical protein